MLDCRTLIVRHDGKSQMEVECHMQLVADDLQPHYPCECIVRHNVEMRSTYSIINSVHQGTCIQATDRLVAGRFETLDFYDHARAWNPHDVHHIINILGKNACDTTPTILEFVLV